ncbi:Putative RxLR effector [Phytophthora palmivora]|uniref:RxLR effector protein n=1 Tax=Phytophthora palmivora TaxID=4796 RepID=A0A2P4XNV7_9STRA|nr:Putative RxLR effector [Phytophthora palmivora]
MRLSFVLLAVIVISTSNATSNADPTAILPKTSMGLIYPSDALNGPSDKRVLRVHRKSEVEDFVDIIDGEERGISITSEQLSNLIKGSTRDIFQNWVRQGHSAGEVANALNSFITAGKLTDDRARDIARWFRDVKKS